MYFLLIVIALIVHGSLYPWSFHSGAGGQNPLLVLLNSWPTKFDSAALSDTLTNIALYLPLGFAAFLWAARHVTRGMAAAIALGLGLALSISMELLQVYVPGRVTSLGDVASNFGGTALGLMAAMIFHKQGEAAAEFVARRFRQHFASSGTLLLICWVAYQLFPFTPQIRIGNLPFEFTLLAHPDGFLPAELWTNVAEWFAVALILQSLFGRMEIRWLVAAVVLRIALRPLLLTRGFALDELVGVALAALLWCVLSDNWRLRAGMAIMASAILLRLLTPLPFSHLPSYLGPGGVAFRRAFDYGAVVWMLCLQGWPLLRAGTLVVTSLVLLVGIELFLPGRRASLSVPTLALLITMALWLSERYLQGRDKKSILR
ncbi:MAG: VanZ family protein [Terriglobia bacterium]